MTDRHFTFGKRIAFAAVLVLGGLAGLAAAPPASAEYRHPGPNAIAAWFPGRASLAPVNPKRKLAPGVRHWLIKGGRDPEIFVWSNPRKLVVEVQTNGIDNFGQVLDVLVDKLCAWRADGLGRSLMSRLYKTKSQIPEKPLGGNAGSSFRKTLRVTRNGCRIDLRAWGGRWHFFRVTIQAN